MAKYYVSLIKIHQPTGPYYLGGWSLGGIIALEMATELQFQNEIVTRVILIDAINPEKIDKKRKQTEYDPNNENDSLLKEVIGIDMFNLLQKNIELAEIKIYEHTPSKYEGETVLLVAKDEPSLINSYGWEDTVKQLKIVDIPGTHNELFDNKYIQSTAESVEKALDSTLFASVGTIQRKYSLKIREVETMTYEIE